MPLGRVRGVVGGGGERSAQGWDRLTVLRLKKGKRGDRVREGVEDVVIIVGRFGILSARGTTGSIYLSLSWDFKKKKQVGTDRLVSLQAVGRHSEHFVLLFSRRPHQVDIDRVVLWKESPPLALLWRWVEALHFGIPLRLTIEAGVYLCGTLSFETIADTEK